MMSKIILIFWMMVLLSSGLGQISAQDDPEPVTLRNTESFHIYSEYVGDNYQISVALPFGYADSDETYPVLYLLDPHFFMGTVTEQTRLLRASDELPPLIVVGIGYPPNSEQTIAELRGRDYIPSVNFANPGSEHVEAFLSFINLELIPYIESHYRTQPEDRTLSGYSFGGIFTLYAFAKVSDTFHRYLVVSPNLPWSTAELQTWSPQITPANPDLDAHLFISVGELEGSTQIMENYADLLADFPNLEVKTIQLYSVTHYSAYAMGLTWGLKTVYCIDPTGYTCEVN